MADTRSDLSPAELEFVELYITRDIHRMPRYKMVKAAFGENFTDGSASTIAWKLLRDPRIRSVIDSHLQETVRESVASLDEIREYLTTVIRGYESEFNGLADWSFEPDENGEAYRFCAVVDDANDIPDPLRPFVDCVASRTDGRWEIKIRQDDLTRERLKAAEVLAKLQGGFTERVELSGGVVVAEAGITPDMSAEEASRRYRALLTGGGK